MVKLQPLLNKIMVVIVFIVTATSITFSFNKYILSGNYTYINYEGNLSSYLLYCEKFVSSISSLILYSHFFPSILAVIISLYLWRSNNKDFIIKMFLGICVFFVLWSIINTKIWFGYLHSELIMYLWSIIELVSIFVFIFSFYFIYAFIKNENPSLYINFIIFIGVMPIIFFLPSEHNLHSYNLQECVAIENQLYNLYSQIFKLALSIFMLILPAYSFIRRKTYRKKDEVIIITMGLLTFILSFLGSGYAASLKQDFLIEFYGLFSMIIFISASFYSIIKFQTFSIKTFVKQNLIVFILALVVSQVLFIQANTDFMVIIINIFLSTVFALILVTGIHKEVKQREEIEKFNQQKSALISIVTHDIGTPLTVLKCYVSMIKEEQDGDINEIKIPLKSLDIIEKSTEDLIQVINDFVEVCNIDDKKIIYDIQ